jgi:methylmalonyl-CoA mutase
MTNKTYPPLAAEFPAATEAVWRALVDGVLKGAPFERRLMPKTAEGLAYAPLLPRSREERVIAGARGTTPWAVHARLDDPDPARGNAILLEELQGGADAVSLFFDTGFAARGFGLPAPDVATLDAALAGVHLDLVAIRMETSPRHGRAAAEAFARLAKARRLPGETLRVDFGFSVFVYLALVGLEAAPFAEAMSGALRTMHDLQSQGFKGPFFRCDGRPFHDAGAGDAQELATIIAQAVSYIRAMDAAGIPAGEAAGLLGFTLAVDQDQFAGIAKLRALRLLWARVEALLGLPPRAIPIHAETSFRMLTKRDAEVNILRSTIAAFAAAAGGADSLAVLPFTQANGLPDAASRRLARNTSLILSAETNLHRVVDPAAGAGAIEAMTDTLAEAAWGFFREIEAERAGDLLGMPAALSSGMLAARIATTRAALMREISSRKWPITGTSEFPNLAETAPAVLAPASAMLPSGAFPAMRLAEPFEVLRDRADALAAAGKPPRVFLANLGTIAEFTPRAGFAKNAYEAGGIRAITNDGFAEEGGTDLVALTEAFKASGASIACLCGTDAAYAAEACDAAMALIASGAEAVHLAGKPGDLEAALRSAGVSDFLALGMDMPAFLAGVLGEAACG